MKIWTNEDLRRVLIRIVSWYVEAQSLDPVEAAIPAAQIALETLAATVPIRPDLDDPRLGLNAEGRLARLLRRCGIPLEIPIELKSLHQAAGPQPWRNGPHAITELRNDITHPRQKRVWSGDAMVDVWRLAVWYIELAVLAWLGYAGVYNRRTRYYRWVGLVDPVPWMRGST